MLADKVLIVTGAGSGLGRSTAVEIAKEGGTVIACDLEEQSHKVDRTLEAIGDATGRGVANCGNVTDRDYVRSLVSEVIENFGRIDGVVNYAGILRDSMVFNMDSKAFDDVLNVHLTGHFNLLSELSSHWRERSKSEGLDSQRSFIGVSSAAARGNPGQVNYSAAKAGVLGMVRTAARELAQYNIRVNAMIPAAVTPMMEDGLSNESREELPLERLGPEKVTPLPIALFANGAENLTGWTFAIGADAVYSVSDPEFTHQAIMKGGWSPEELGDTLDRLVSDDGRSKTGYAGLFRKLVARLA